MPMFLRMREGVELNDELIPSLKQTLRQKCSPRHEPDRFYAVDEIPYTSTGRNLKYGCESCIWAAAGKGLKPGLHEESRRNWLVSDFVATTTDYEVPDATG